MPDGCLPTGYAGGGSLWREPASSGVQPQSSTEQEGVGVVKEWLMYRLRAHITEETCLGGYELRYREC